jgi:hypothetical protein
MGSQFSGLPVGGVARTSTQSVVLAGSNPIAGWIALLDGSQAELVRLSGLLTQGAPSAFAGAPPQTLAEIAATDRATALLSAGSTAASDAGPSGDGGGTAPGLRLQLGGSPVGGIAYALAGTWGAIAAEGGRVFVLSDSASGDQAAEWTTFDLGGTGPAAGAGLAPLGQGVVLGGDVAFRGDRAVFAVQQSGAISLLVYDHASTTPTPLRSLLMSNDPRVPSQATVRDGRVAIAASDTRVAIAWATAANLGPNEAVGGYAVYACSP